MAGQHGFTEKLKRDLESPIQVRRFGSGWFSGFFALVLAILGCGLIAALRWPDVFATPELEPLRNAAGLRPFIHAVLLASYALALLSLLLRPRKALGFCALAIGVTAAVLGGANVQPQETADWGIFFGLDFFVVNMAVTGLMFAPIERLFPHRRDQRLFRIEWREDLFYYLISSMMVQVFTFLALAPSTFINAHTSNWDAFRAGVACRSEQGHDPRHGAPVLLKTVDCAAQPSLVQHRDGMGAICARLPGEGKRQGRGIVQQAVLQQPRKHLWHAGR